MTRTNSRPIPLRNYDNFDFAPALQMTESIMQVGRGIQHCDEAHLIYSETGFKFQSAQFTTGYPSSQPPIAVEQEFAAYLALAAESAGDTELFSLSEGLRVWGAVGSHPVGNEGQSLSREIWGTNSAHSDLDPACRGLCPFELSPRTYPTTRRNDVDGYSLGEYLPLPRTDGEERLAYHHAPSGSLHQRYDSDLQSPQEQKSPLFPCRCPDRHSEEPSPRKFRRRVGSDRMTSAGLRRRTKKTPSAFECDIDGCNSSFTAKHNLKFHQKSHYGIKDLICPGCLRGFGIKHMLVRHMDTCPSLPLSP